MTTASLQICLNLSLMPLLPLGQNACLTPLPHPAPPWLTATYRHCPSFQSCRIMGKTGQRVEGMEIGQQEGMKRSE